MNVPSYIGKLVRRWPLLRVLDPSNTLLKNELGMIISQHPGSTARSLKVRVLWLTEREHDLVYGFYVDTVFISENTSVLNQMLDLKKEET